MDLVIEKVVRIRPVNEAGCFEYQIKFIDVPQNDIWYTIQNLSEICDYDMLLTQSSNQDLDTLTIDLINCVIENSVIQMSLDLEIEVNNRLLLQPEQRYTPAQLYLLLERGYFKKYDDAPNFL